MFICFLLNGTPFLIFCGCLKSLLYLQFPIGEAKTFRGLVDVVTKEQIIWKPTSDLDDGKNFEQKLLREADDSNLFQEVQDARNTLIEQVKF